MVPGLEERLMSGDTEVVHTCATLVSQDGQSRAIIASVPQ